MRGFKAFIAGWTCSVAMTAAAHAADMPGDWVPPLEKPVFTDLVSGWYVRVDGAYRWQDFGSIESPNFVSAWNIRSVGAAGFGVGYKYQWFRADLTADYGWPARFEADTAAVSPFYTAKLSSFTVLANVYLDLGEWAGFTPYVGGGIGAANLRIKDLVLPSLILYPALVSSANHWNLSWAVMAGVAYRISPKLVLDVGYRYLSMGDIVGAPEPPLYTGQTSFADVTAQELRVGFRWMFD